MKLYHGTNSEALATILTSGLKPRGKGRGNWKHTVDSHPDMVYLTNAYALWFAYVASSESGGDMVVVEIDTALLNPFRFVPDEDFLEQATRTQSGLGLAPTDKPMKYRNRWYCRHIREFSQHWEDSLKHLGNCSYDGDIPTSAITRFAVIPGYRAPGLVMAGIDPSITLMNYKLLGEKYCNWTRWAFGDPLEPGGDHSVLPPDYMSKVSRDGIIVRSIKELV